MSWGAQFYRSQSVHFVESKKRTLEQGMRWALTESLRVITSLLTEWTTARGNKKKKRFVFLDSSQWSFK